MSSEYTDQDTERVRQSEASSAGKLTQNLGQLPSFSEATPPQRRSNNNVIALLLSGLGAFMLFGQLFPSGDDLLGGMILLTIASCFLFFALWKRIYGLLIPGCILGGLSLGIPFTEITDGVSVFWGLALGFLAILFVGRSLFRVSNHWPIYPAIPLFAVGTIVAIANAPSFFIGGLIWLPLLLIGAGLYLGWGRQTA